MIINERKTGGDAGKALCKTGVVQESGPLAGFLDIVGGTVDPVTGLPTADTVLFKNQGQCVSFVESDLGSVFRFVLPPPPPV